MKTYRSKITGVFVGRQADQIEGEEYETVEVPTNPKEALIDFLNTIQKVDGQPSEPEPAPPAGWLRKWQLEKQEQGQELHLAIELDQAIMRAPFERCMRLAELVYSRLGDFAKKEKKDDAS